MSFVYLILKQYLPPNVVSYILALNNEEKLCKYGELTLLKKLKIDKSNLNNYLEIALNNNQFEIAKYLIEIGAVCDFKKILCDCEDFELIRYLTEDKNIDIPKEAVENTVIQGRFEIFVHFLGFNNVYYSKKYLEKAMMYFKYDIVKFIIKNRYFNKNKNNILLWAVKDNHFEIVQMLVDEGMRIDEKILKRAIKNNNIDIVEFLIKKNPSCLTMKYVEKTFKKKRFILFKHMISLNKYDLNKLLFDALFDNKLKAAKYLIEKGAVINEKKILTFVCRMGHLKIVKFLIEKGFQFNENHLIISCEKRNMKLLKYILVVNPNLPKGKTLKTACRARYFEIVKFLLKNGAVITSEIFNIAQNNNYFEIVKLFNKKYEINNEILDLACKKLQYDIIEIFKKKYFEQMLYIVCEKKYYPTAKFLASIDNSKLALKIAKEKEYTEFIDYLNKKN